MRTRISGADVDMTWDGSIVVMKASGMVTGPACLQMHKRLLRAVRTRTALGVAVDIRSAVIAMSEAEYFEFVREVTNHRIPQRVAFLAGPWAMKIGDVHVQLMSRGGLDRRFFDDESTAMNWLAAQAA